MSSLALYRMVVRLSHDPKFLALLSTEPELAFLETELNSEERAWLLAVDKRAFTVNQNVAKQTLGIIAKEVDVPTILTISAGGTLLLNGFFSDSKFHRAVQAGESLTVAFCDYLMGMTLQGSIHDRRVFDVSRFFHMTARITHDPCAKSEFKEEIVLAENVDFGWFPAGLLELISSVRSRFRDIHVSDNVLLMTSGVTTELPILDQECMRPILIEVVSEPKRIVKSRYIEPALADLLTPTRSPGCTQSTLFQTARRLGVTANVDEIIAQLHDDGLIVQNHSGGGESHCRFRRYTM